MKCQLSLVSSRNSRNKTRRFGWTVVKVTTVFWSRANFCAAESQQPDARHVEQNLTERCNLQKPDNWQVET